MRNNKHKWPLHHGQSLVHFRFDDELATCACESCTSRLYLSNTLEQGTQIFLSLHAGKSKLVCPGTEGIMLYTRFDKYKVLMQNNNRNGYFVMNQVAENLKSQCPETENASLSRIATTTHAIPFVEVPFHVGRTNSCCCCKDNKRNLTTHACIPL